MRLKKLPVLLVPLCLVAGLPARAQGPLNPPAPLLTAPAQTAPSPATTALSIEAAHRAQELGFPSLAAGMYRQLLTLPGADQAGLTLALASALLDDGQPAESDKILQALPGPHSSAWHLRVALAAVQLRKVDVARTELAAIKLDELSAADGAWASFLQGAIFDIQIPQDLTKANSFYIKAEESAPNEMARARFKLAGEQVRLVLNAPSEAQLRQTRLNYDANRGRPFAYEFAKTHAQALHQLGRTKEAADFLQGVLQSMLPQERSQGDQLLLVQGLIADKAPGGLGRRALSQLLATGSDQRLQRVALQLLARASSDEVTRGVLRAELNRLIDAPTKHPILESLLLVRGQLALTEKDYAQAERDARALLEQYPGSPYTVHAFGVLTASTWEQRRYRAAADNARKARGVLPAEARSARAELVLLEAEAWFRAGGAGDNGDFRNAADAYAAALKERPAGVKPGDLMFQRVLSEMKAGALEAAQPLLDELARDPEFDLENRWRAEWNLARALQLQGLVGVKQAYARVNALLGEKPGDNPTALAALSPDLRSRMVWLQARLALDAGEAERAIKLIDDMGPLLATLAEPLRLEIASTSMLVKADAYFTLGREGDALKALQQLREDPKLAKSLAAAQSYLIEAGHYAAQEKTVDAQKLFTRLADEFPGELAAYALYQAALQAERRGQEANYKEANNLIEDLVRKYPRSELVFDARLKQGDLLRRLNNFPAAQYAYEDLINNNRQGSQENLIIAQLALAACHNAQSANDPVHFDRARSIYEHLRDRADAPADVRVEAGYNLGELWVRREDYAKAYEAWWSGVVKDFLLDPTKAAQLQSKGRNWVARTLYRLGEVLEQQGKLNEANNAWRMIVDLKLDSNGEALARAKLVRALPPEAKP